MTITRKPTRRVGAPAGKTVGAEEFIKAAQHSTVSPPGDGNDTAGEPPVPDEEPSLLAEAERPIKKDKKHKEKKKKNKKKEAVLIRFDDSQLAAIDDIAERLGLSRAAWVRMVVAKALAQGNS